MRKRTILFLVMSLQLFIIGCSNNNKDINPNITREFLKQHAVIGMTDSEISIVFGKEAFREFGDGSFVWIFDRVTNNYTYKPDLQRVAFEDIKSGKIKYQLYINELENKAFMFSYFYKGDNNEVWNYEIRPDGTSDKQATTS
ncbi:hypothetical protein [Cohnella lupini]|uniref:hypothetical protein n=1 Tax=Cohnella lupini TaxID=1294267 RepID=UPI000E28655D|nr:hypothetical protein [Cohnella lupini]